MGTISKTKRQHTQFLKRETILPQEFQVIACLQPYEKKLIEGQKMKRNKKPIKLGQAIQKILKDRGISLKELSYESGIPISTLSHFKNGREPRDLSAIKILCECLNCTMEELLFDEANEKQNSSDIASELFTGVFEVTVKKVKKRGES